MQTLTKKSKLAACVPAFPGDRRRFGVPTEPSEIKPSAVKRSNTQEPKPEQSRNKNEEGFIIVKKGEGVFYVRYDIIFAKAGDIFFMPRKVPKDFNSGTDHIFEATKGEFEKFFNGSFLPFMGDDHQVTERVPTKDEFEEFAELSETF